MRRFDAESLLGMESTLSPKDLQPFTYPSNEEIEKINLRGLYLGNYVRWDSQRQTENMINKYGYESAMQRGLLILTNLFIVCLMQGCMIM